MAAYATTADVQARLTRTLEDGERSVCEMLLEDAAVIIDSYNADAEETAKKTVSCRMVLRALGDGSMNVPIGTSQGSMTALGYTQSWTVASGGSVGELYLGRLEKQLLGVAGRIGSYSPVEELVPQENAP